MEKLQMANSYYAQLLDEFGNIVGSDEAQNVHTMVVDHDTIRDAVLTCARKPTRVGLIYRTETTTKNCKTEKLKSKADKFEVTVKVWGIM